MPEELLKLEIEGGTMKELMSWRRAARGGLDFFSPLLAKPRLVPF